MKKLLVFDANSILNRAFYGVRPLTNKAGLHTNAVYGYLNIITKHIDHIAPDAVAAAFDLSAPTFRHKMYEGYKAGRHKMPEELAEQIPYIKAVTEALGIEMLSSEGYEADDILGTLSVKYPDTHTYIVTGDRDSLQLVCENTTVILATTGKDDEYTPEKVREKYLVEPDKLIDVKALMGDSSDNIPGVSGIGEKGAIKLICENGDIDTLFDKIDKEELKLTPSLKEKLISGRESAFFSRTLATICKSVPISITLENLLRKPIDNKRLHSLFLELEFTRLSEKFGLTSPATSADDMQISFDTQESDASEPKEITCDDFVTGDDLLFCDFAPESKALYRELNREIVSTKLSASVLKKLSEKKLCLWSSKEFWHYCLSENFDFPKENIVFDIKMAAYVENPDTKGNFQHILMRTLSHSLPSVFADSPAHRAPFIKPLYEALEQSLHEMGAQDLYYSTELPCTRVLAVMEHTGFCLDKESLEEYGNILLDKMRSTEEQIYQLSGERFNINSPKQLGHVLFEKLNLPVIKKKKTGYSTDAETLEKLRFRSPVVEYILEYRKIAKLHGTYVDGLLKVVGEDGRIRTDFKQAGTLTGRLSSAEPNLQNIPIRTEEGSLMRKFFTCPKGKVLIDADYSQIELRLLAHISQDEEMIDAFNSGADIHTITASKVFKTPLEEVTPALRTRAKAVNFGIVYGIGEFSLSEDLHISIKEAKEYIEGYFSTYKKVKEYLNNTVELATKTGYVETLFGRRRYIPELSSSKKTMQGFGKRVAMNTPIQGTAADIIKKAMVNVAHRLEKEALETKLILQVHDELILEAPIAEAQTASLILKEEMENAVKLSVQLKTDVGIGNNWLEAKK